MPEAQFDGGPSIAEVIEPLMVTVDVQNANLFVLALFLTSFRAMYTCFHLSSSPTVTEAPGLERVSFLLQGWVLEISLPRSQTEPQARGSLG